MQEMSQETVNEFKEMDRRLHKALTSSTKEEAEICTCNPERSGLRVRGAWMEERHAELFVAISVGDQTRTQNITMFLKDFAERSTDDKSEAHREVCRQDQESLRLSRRWRWVKCGIQFPEDPFRIVGSRQDRTMTS